MERTCLSIFDPILPVHTYNYFDKNNTLREIELNLLECFLRVIFGAFEPTHQKNLLKGAYLATISGNPLQSNLNPPLDDLNCRQKILGIFEKAQGRFPKYDLCIPILETSLGIPVQVTLCYNIAERNEEHHKYFYINSITMGMSYCFSVANAGNYGIDPMFGNSIYMSIGETTTDPTLSIAPRVPVVKFLNGTFCPNNNGGRDHTRALLFSATLQHIVASSVSTKTFCFYPTERLSPVPGMNQTTVDNNQTVRMDDYGWKLIKDHKLLNGVFKREFHFNAANGLKQTDCFSAETPKFSLDFAMGHFEH